MSKPLGPKPFAKKTFYLDLKGYRQEHELAKDLKKLGGKQEMFLSKEVTFVVTNKRIKDSTNFTNPLTAQNTGKSSPLLSIENLEKDKSCRNASPLPDSNRYPQIFRSKSLVQKAIEKNQGTTDVFEICKLWKIKIYPLSKVLSWINKYKTLYWKKYPEEKQHFTITKGDVKVHQLQTPFIKIEHNKNIYKTKYKLFTSSMNAVDSQLYYGVKQIFKEWQLSKLKENGIPNQNFPPYNDIDSKSLNKSVPSPLFAIPSYWTPCTSTQASHQVHMKHLSSTSQSISLAKSKKTAKQDKENEKKHIKNPTKKNKKRYCEVCNDYFTNMNEHLETKNHKEFFNDSTNFYAVHDIISKLPTYEDALKHDGYVSLKETLLNEENRHSNFFADKYNSNNALNEMALINSDNGAENYSEHQEDIINSSYSTIENETPFPFLESNINKLDEKQNCSLPEKVISISAPNEADNSSNSCVLKILTNEKQLDEISFNNDNLANDNNSISNTNNIQMSCLNDFQENNIKDSQANLYNVAFDNIDLSKEVITSTSNDVSNINYFASYQEQIDNANKDITSLNAKEVNDYAPENKKNLTFEAYDFPKNDLNAKDNETPNLSMLHMNESPLPFNINNKLSNENIACKFKPMLNLSECFTSPLVQIDKNKEFVDTNTISPLENDNLAHYEIPEVSMKTLNDTPVEEMLNDSPLLHSKETSFSLDFHLSNAEYNVNNESPLDISTTKMKNVQNFNCLQNAFHHKKLGCIKVDDIVTSDDNIPCLDNINNGIIPSSLLINENTIPGNNLLDSSLHNPLIANAIILNNNETEALQIASSQAIIDTPVINNINMNSDVDTLDTNLKLNQSNSPILYAFHHKKLGYVPIDKAFIQDENFNNFETSKVASTQNKNSVKDNFKLVNNQMQDKEENALNIKNVDFETSLVGKSCNYALNDQSASISSEPDSHIVLNNKVLDNKAMQDILNITNSTNNCFLIEKMHFIKNIYLASGMNLSSHAEINQCSDSMKMEVNFSDDEGFENLSNQINNIYNHLDNECQSALDLSIKH